MYIYIYVYNIYIQIDIHSHKMAICVTFFVEKKLVYYPISPFAQICYFLANLSQKWPIYNYKSFPVHQLGHIQKKYKSFVIIYKNIIQYEAYTDSGASPLLLPYILCFYLLIALIILIVFSLISFSFSFCCYCSVTLFYPEHLCHYFTDSKEQWRCLRCQGYRSAVDGLQLNGK